MGTGGGQVKRKSRPGGKATRIRETRWRCHTRGKGREKWTQEPKKSTGGAMKRSEIDKSVARLERGE